MTDEETNEAVILGAATCKLTGRMLAKLEAKPRDHFRVMMIAHLLRMLRFTEAAVLLARSGNLEPACAVTRTVLEMGWVLLAIKDDPSKFETWREDANYEGKKSIKRLKLLGEQERLPATSDSAIDAAMQGMPAGKKFNLKDWAAAGGAAGSYPTIYQMLSACAHAEMSSTYAYAKWDEASMTSIGIGDPDLQELPADSLCVCVALLLDGVRYIAGDLLRDEHLRHVEECEARHRALTLRLDHVRMRHVEQERRDDAPSA